MKKFFFWSLIAIFVLGVTANDSFAQNRGYGKGNRGYNRANFVDSNNDGICDNLQARQLQKQMQGNTQRQAATYQGRGINQRLRLRTFVDQDGDGKCDNYEQRASIRQGSTGNQNQQQNKQESAPKKK